jgi:tetratricopeptide (TPR) repeat protein
MFEETIHLEPKSSIGYALAALAYLQQTSQYADTQSVNLLNRARELAEQALALEDVTGLADLVLAHVYLRENKHEKALAAAERTVLARPSCDAAFAVKAEVLNYLGKSTEAIGLAKFAMRLAPVYPSYYPAVLSAAYYGSSRFQEALDAAEVSFEADPNNLDALLLMVAANSALGRYDQAQKAVNNLRSIRPEFTIDTFATNHPYKDLKSLEKMVSQLKRAGL